MNWKGKIYFGLTWAIVGLAFLCTLPFFGVGHVISHVAERWMKSSKIAKVGFLLSVPTVIVVLLSTGLGKEDIPEWAKKNSPEPKRRYTKRL